VNTGTGRQSTVEARTPARTASRRSAAASVRATCSCAYTPIRSSPSHTPHTRGSGDTTARRDTGKRQGQLLPGNLRPVGGAHRATAARSAGPAPAAVSAPVPVPSPGGSAAGRAGSSAR